VPIALRPWRPEDAPAVHAVCQDPEILRWIPEIPRPYTLAQAREYVGGALGPHHLAVVDGVRVVGAVGMDVADDRIGHVGYWCAPKERRRGVATSALRLMCRRACGELGLERIELVADPDNVASQRVAEKAGFTREAVLRSHVRHPDGRRRDAILFSLLCRELRE
jgi:RimJ/RimL family protein N-acetyltransferase